MYVELLLSSMETLLCLKEHFSVHRDTFLAECYAFLYDSTFSLNKDAFLRVKTLSAYDLPHTPNGIEFFSACGNVILSVRTLFCL
jgi:hypothetical protein